MINALSKNMNADLRNKCYQCLFAMAYIFVNSYGKLQLLNSYTGYNYVNVISGTGNAAVTDGSKAVAQFKGPFSIAKDPTAPYYYISDYYFFVRRLSILDYSLITINPGNLYNMASAYALNKKLFLFVITLRWRFRLQWP